MTVRPARLLAAPATIAALLVAGCGGGGDGDTAAGGRDALSVVATTTQVADFARAVGGDRIAVHQILQPNTDPHEYEPRPDDIRAASGADVVLESGDGLDHWIDEVAEQAGAESTVTDLASSNVQRLAGEEEEDEEGGHDHGDSAYDPHWWHDPRNAEAAVAAIAKDLADADPDGAATYRRNAAAYTAKLRNLDRGIARCMAQVPAAERKLVTDHDAFNYFTRRYDVTVVGAVIPSQTTTAQTSARDVAALTRVIRAEGVKAIFPESSVNPRVARSIARQTGASADHELYGDTLGPKDSDGATYLQMEAHNADAMVRGFTDGKQDCAIDGL